jgi:hypothetical protein
MAESIYLLCALTSMACVLLLLRGFRRTKVRLLFWSSLCFVGLALNNLLLFVDLVVLGPETSLAAVRGAAALFGLSAMAFGLVWES